MTTVGADISATTGGIDDFSQYTQIVPNTNTQRLNVPMKYVYASAAKTMFLVGLCAGGNCTSNMASGGTNYYSTIHIPTVRSILMRFICVPATCDTDEMFFLFL